MNEIDNILNLYSNCIPVKGNRRSIICDLQRKNYLLIPNHIHDLLINYSKQSKETIYDEVESKSHQILSEYFSFLEENEFIFWSSQKESSFFPEINLDWLWPAYISNAIIDINQYLNVDYSQILSDLETLGCNHLQIRCYENLNFNVMFNFISKLSGSSFKSIEIIVRYNPEINVNDLRVFLSKNQRVKSIILFHSPFTKIENELIENTNTTIVYVRDKINGNSFCGQIHHNYFNTNTTLFTEAQYHNTCLNRKISVDVNGDIKNCPSMVKSYGNIKDTTLAEAIEKPGFKDMWFINKDKIHVCKDCEFRYICTDCRAYIENPEDIYSKPLKCGYNPYTAEWEEWSTNPLKQKAIEYYGMQELIKKEK